MDLRKTYILHARSQSIIDWMHEQEMLISMENKESQNNFLGKGKDIENILSRMSIK